MKILIAPDKFKGSLNALEVGNLIKQGLLAANSNFEVVIFPLADGGEGTAEILTYHSQGSLIEVSVNDPLFRPIQAQYGLAKDGKTAFIEMAKASGLVLLKESERNPLKTSTLGTGELIADALQRGVETIILGIGGSATNDLGIGMAEALGYEFLDKNGKKLIPIGANLLEIKDISTKKVIPTPKKVRFVVASDVKNRLFGKDGAAYVYARQKGADDKTIEILDQGLMNMSQVIENQLGTKVSTIIGGGAAGGLGAGAVAFLNAEIKAGIDIVMNYTQFESQLADYQLIITGEGKIDQQTLQGKVIAGVCQKAQKRQIPVVAVCGSLDIKPTMMKELGLAYAESIIPQAMSLPEAIATATPNLQNWAFRFGTLLSYWRGVGLP
jgi:glycerate kinase